jgi:hypothetical protein
MHSLCRAQTAGMDSVRYGAGVPRSTASIDAEIAVLEARVSTDAVNSVGADGVSASTDLQAIEARLDQLYRQRDRLTGNAKMFVRGVIKGL